MLPHGPLALAGQRIGLLGGSFNPPHAGHLHITRWALRSFALDQVWWLVTPGNPLKAEAPASLPRRMAAARALARDPRVRVTDLEVRLGTRFTAETLARLKGYYPGVRFLWLMGADNLTGFHHWDRWQDIMEMVPVGVLGRPGQQVAAGLAPAARRFAAARVEPGAARRLADMPPTAWTLLTGPMVDLSSSEIRARGGWR